MLENKDKLKYIAFMRGIMPSNPNQRNENFRQVFKDLGFSNIQTVLASGNVIFESNSLEIQKMETMIENALLEKQYGKKITTRTWQIIHRILNKMNST
jgi:uncharacterized protein (DUF1697 family)